MSVLLETSAGNMVVDLFTEHAPQNTLSFVKLCKIKYYNYCVFHNVQKGFAAQSGDPTMTGKGGESLWGVLGRGAEKLLPHEINPALKHKRRGMVCMAPLGGKSFGAQDSDLQTGAYRGQRVNGSQFFITLGDGLDYLDGRYTIIGEVVEGLDVLDRINDAYVDETMRPLRDIRVKHTIVLDDPFDDPEGLQVPDASPLPTKEQLHTGRLDAEEDLDKEVDETEQETKIREAEARAQALTLEMVGDLPFAEVKPPENVIFVCRLNPITRDEDLEMIFSRFGKITKCEVIRDRKTGDSLCYAFVEFDEKESAEEAFFKMDNVLIDDRRIHVDLSQSVSRLHGAWNAKRVASKAYASHLPEGLEHKRRKHEYGGERGGPREREREAKYDMVFSHTERRDSGSAAEKDAEERRRRDPYRPRADPPRDRRERERDPISGRDRERERERDQGSGRDREREREREREYAGKGSDRERPTSGRDEYTRRGDARDAPRPDRPRSRSPPRARNR